MAMPSSNDSLVSSESFYRDTWRHSASLRLSSKSRCHAERSEASPRFSLGLRGGSGTSFNMTSGAVEDQRIALLWLGIQQPPADVRPYGEFPLDNPCSPMRCFP